MRALDSSPGNLRPPSTSFIGRESELDQVQAAVRAYRLVTLTGVSGVGKTRLTLEVAGHLANEFPDGVWVFELAARQEADCGDLLGALDHTTLAIRNFHDAGKARAELNG